MRPCASWISFSVASAAASNVWHPPSTSHAVTTYFVSAWPFDGGVVHETSSVSYEVAGGVRVSAVCTSTDATSIWSGFVEIVATVMPVLGTDGPSVFSACRRTSYEVAGVKPLTAYVQPALHVSCTGMIRSEETEPVV